MAIFNGTTGADILPPLATGAADAAGNDTLNGLAGDDTLAGWAGDDILTGGPGADALIGGTISVDGTTGTTAPAGADTASYAGSTAGVQIDLGSVGSYTRVAGGITLTLTNASLGHGGDAEGDYLTGITHLIGSAFDDRLFGNHLANSLQGGAGADTLVGGRGADTMAGGAGGDLYGVDNAGDTVIELVGEGFDTVIASVDYSLPANAENLELSGHAIRGTGNSLENQITGNAEDNIIDGGVGGGYDFLSGGEGNDTLSNASHMDGGPGDDRLMFGTYVMFDISLFLGGEGNDFLYGGPEQNWLRGGPGNDILIGGASSVRDPNDFEWPEEGMEGGPGDDIFSVDSDLDLVIERAGEGRDRVNASIDYTLRHDVEDLSLTGRAAHGLGNDLANLINGNDYVNVLNGAAGDDRLLGRGGNDSMAGSSGADRLFGGDGNDRLLGGDDNDYLLGGNGSDRLAGNAGADTFAFEGPGAGADRIIDFEDGIDHIELNRAGFGIGPGAINVVNAASSTGITGDAVFYQTTTGSLFWHDGGTAADTLFATMDNLPAALDSTDFVLV